MKTGQAKKNPIETDEWENWSPFLVGLGKVVAIPVIGFAAATGIWTGAELIGNAVSPYRPHKAHASVTIEQCQAEHGPQCDTLWRVASDIQRQERPSLRMAGIVVVDDLNRNGMNQFVAPLEPGKNGELVTLGGKVFPRDKVGHEGASMFLGAFGFTRKSGVFNPNP